MIQQIHRPHWLPKDVFRTLIEQASPFPQCKHCQSVEELSVDHIVAKWAGGTDDLSNLQFLCRLCNSRKGVRSDSYWEQNFFWDNVPDVAHLAYLREAQKRLFQEIISNDHFGKMISEIARVLYICAWIVGSGKTLAIPVAAWALNYGIIQRWGKAARRVDRILVLCKEAAIRDQIAVDLPNDLINYGVVNRAPIVGVIKDGDQLSQDHWLGGHDVIVSCIQQFWTKNNTPRADLLPLLAKFPLIAFDEPHYGNEQVKFLVEHAADSLCIGFTGTPINGCNELLEKMILLSVYDYEDADTSDHSLKYVNDQKGDLAHFVREMNLHDAAITLRGKSQTTTTTIHDGYEKNIEPAKAVVRGVIQEVKEADALQPDFETLAPHRGDQFVMASKFFPVHSIVYFEAISIAEQLASDANRLFESERGEYPLEKGYRVEVVHAGTSEISAKPLARDPNQSPHPWMRAYRNKGQLDKECARFLFVVGIGREGLNNPFCNRVGVATPASSILPPVQGWIGRQMRSYLMTRNGVIEAPPETLDTVRIITHEAFGVLSLISDGFHFLRNMRESMAGLPTIADLENEETPTYQSIQKKISLTRKDKIDIVAWIDTQTKQNGREPTPVELIAKWAPQGNKQRERKVIEWVNTVKKGSHAARIELQFNSRIIPWVIVRRERLHDKPDNKELERLIRIYYPALINCLPITPETKPFVTQMHNDHSKQYQLPPIIPGTSINALCRERIGGSVLHLIESYYQGPPELIWQRSTMAAKIKLGVPRGEKLADRSDWDTPQTQALINRPDVGYELVNYVVDRLIQEGHCPALNALKSTA